MKKLFASLQNNWILFAKAETENYLDNFIVIRIIVYFYFTHFKNYIFKKYYIFYFSIIYKINLLSEYPYTHAHSYARIHMHTDIVIKRKRFILIE